MRKVLFVLASLITLAALLLAEENWRGARAFANYKRAMEAKGEHFDAARLIPPKVPDDQNFAMTPYFAPSFDLPAAEPRQPVKLVTNLANGQAQPDYTEVNKNTNTNILAQFQLPNPDRPPNRFTWHYGLAGDLIPWAVAFQGTNSAARPAEISDPVQAASIVLDFMKSCEPTLAELQSASARPFCRFDVPYEEWPDVRTDSVLVDHFAKVKHLYQILTLHAEAEMVLGRTDQALQDLNVLFRVDDGLKDEPLLISQLVRIADVTIMLGAVGEGLAEHRWSDDQLQVLQERLQKTDLLASTILAFRGERDICYNPHFTQWEMFDEPRIYPGAWSRLEQLNVNRALQDFILLRIDQAAREINPSVNHSIDLAFQKSRDGSGFSLFLHHNLLATMVIPGLARVPEKTALAQSGVDMAMLACALERCRLARGQYPEDLNALAPQFLAALPHDIINGQPLKYRRTDNGRFLLYSVGWNEKDDGGAIVTTKAKPPRQDPLQGDWVWQYQEKL
jgi:hypothetical protein